MFQKHVLELHNLINIVVVIIGIIIRGDLLELRIAPYQRALFF